MDTQLLLQIKEAPYLSVNAKERIMFLLKKQPEKLQEVEKLLQEYNEKYLDSLENLVASIEHMYHDMKFFTEKRTHETGSEAIAIIDELLAQALQDDIIRILK